MTTILGYKHGKAKPPCIDTDCCVCCGLIVYPPYYESADLLPSCILTTAFSTSPPHYLFSHARRRLTTLDFVLWVLEPPSLWIPLDIISAGKRYIRNPMFD